MSPRMSPTAAPRQPVTVRAEPGTVVLEIGSLLDADAGAALVAAAEAALATGPDRVDVDLTSLRSWTQDGAAALRQCKAVCGALADGLHYRAGRGAGQAALLAAFS